MGCSRVSTARHPTSFCLSTYRAPPAHRLPTCCLLWLDCFASLLQDLERHAANLEVEMGRLRGSDPRGRLLDVTHSATISTAPSGMPDSADVSRSASRRTSVANLALGAANTAAAVGSSGAAAVDRHSSSGASVAAGERGGGGGSEAPAAL